MDIREALRIQEEKERAARIAKEKKQDAPTPKETPKPTPKKPKKTQKK